MVFAGWFFPLVSLLVFCAAAAPVVVESSRVAPPNQSVLASKGERIGFVLDGYHSSTNQVLGVEWYMDGEFLGFQHVSSLGEVDGSSQQLHFWRGINFPETGNHIIEGVLFNIDGTSRLPIRWDVNVVDRTRVLYVHDAVDLFKNTDRKNKLSSFVSEEGFNALVLYGVDNFLKTVTVSNTDCSTTPAQDDPRYQLSTLIQEARAWGIQHLSIAVGASASTLPGKLEALESYICHFGAGIGGASTMIDGVITEYEFWNEGYPFDTFENLVNGLNEIRARRGIEVAVYLPGRPVSNIEWIVQRVDRILVASYGNEPHISPQIEEALSAMSDTLNAPEVWFAFSAEEEYERRIKCSFGHTTNFMGDWFGEHEIFENALDAAEDQILSDYREIIMTGGDSTGDWRNGLRLRGFAYYRDDYLMDYLTNGPSYDRNPSRPPTACWSDPFPDAPAKNCVTSCGLDGNLRECTVTLSPEESCTFWIKAWDESNNLSGTEWYGWDIPEIHYYSAGNPGFQYVSGTVGGTGSEAEFGRRYHFASPGSYTISVVVFDTESNYGESMTWNVIVG